MEKPVITKECINTLSETKFLNTYDLEYEKGRHYYIATRRNKDTITATKSLAEVDTMLADAVTCYIVIHLPGKDPLLLLQYEYRFPIGQYQLCPPAGIIDEADKLDPNPLIVASKREIFEETGIKVRDCDKMKILCDLVFSTPGFTDECNALVLTDVYRDDLSELTHANCEGTELFGDFVLLDKTDAKALLGSGRDPKGHHYPLYAYAALSYFVINY